MSSAGNLGPSSRKMIIDHLDSRSGVYKISTACGGFYVGSAYDLRRRAKGHLFALKSTRHSNFRLQRDWSAGEVFTIEVLEFAPKGDVLAREEYWITTLMAVSRGYNICPHPTLGKHGTQQSAETRAKIASALTGRKAKPESIEKMRAWKREPVSEQTREKLRLALKGRVMSAAHRESIRQSRVGKKHSPETLEKMAASRVGVRRGPMPQSQKDAISAGRRKTPA